MSQALYRKYRSRSLDEVVGQEHITSLLKRAISRGTVSHAYLLTGPRGVGKTSIARIIAHEINDLPYSEESNHLDIIEIDAASNNGVEDVRDLRDKVHIAPSSAAKKVYIIDEVHMLSKQAFNALLKTLEEPPEHVVFILATTDADKLPATIVSRVQRFNFRAISLDDVVSHLAHIAKQEAIDISDAALRLIAQHGGGSFRDSIGLLDQLQHVSDDKIERSDVEQALGITTDDTLEQLIAAYRSGDLASLARDIKALETSGTQAAIVAHQLIAHLQATIAEHPNDIIVLDKLLDVATSSYPYVKLLAVLAQNAPSEPRTAVVPERQLQPNESDKRVTRGGAVPASSVRDDGADRAAGPADSESRDEHATGGTGNDGSGSVPKKPNSEPQQSTAEQPQSRITLQPSSEFSWQSLLDELKDEVALRSLLSKSSHEIDAETLTIFAGNKFNAGRLNGPKQLPKLSAAIEKLGFGDLTIDIKAEAAPPSDSQLADVAAIMGGGTEVELNQDA